MDTENESARSFSLGAKKATNEIEKVLNKDKTGVETKSEKLNRDLKEEVSWENIYAHVYKTTSEPKLRWFQPRMLYRIIPTNTYLFMCKIKSSVLCVHCAVEEDTLHLLWECEVAKNLLKNVCDWINESTVPSVNFEVTEKLVILGMDGNCILDPVMDLIILLAKYYIYISKLPGTVPSFQGFKYIVKQKYATEVYKSNCKNVYETEERWQKYKPLTV